LAGSEVITGALSRSWAGGSVPHRWGDIGDAAPDVHESVTRFAQFYALLSRCPRTGVGQRQPQQRHRGRRRADTDQFGHHVERDAYGSWIADGG